MWLPVRQSSLPDYSYTANELGAHGEAQIDAQGDESSDDASKSDTDTDTDTDTNDIAGSSAAFSLPYPTRKRALSPSAKRSLANAHYTVKFGHPYGPDLFGAWSETLQSGPALTRDYLKTSAPQPLHTFPTSAQSSATRASIFSPFADRVFASLPHPGVLFILIYGISALIHCGWNVYRKFVSCELRYNPRSALCVGWRGEFILFGTSTLLFLWLSLFSRTTSGGSDMTSKDTGTQTEPVNNDGDDAGSNERFAPLRKLLAEKKEEKKRLNGFILEQQKSKQHVNPKEWTKPADPAMVAKLKAEVQDRRKEAAERKASRANSAIGTDTIFDLEGEHKVLKTLTELRLVEEERLSMYRKDREKAEQELRDLKKLMDQLK